MGKEASFLLKICYLRKNLSICLNLVRFARNDACYTPIWNFNVYADSLKYFSSVVSTRGQKESLVFRQAIAAVHDRILFLLTLAVGLGFVLRLTQNVRGRVQSVRSSVLFLQRNIPSINIAVL
jgi:hypothetical protein